jgi:hypothetical protein
MLPSVWTHQFTKDGLERADSGVAMGPRQEAMGESEKFFKPAQRNRSSSSEVVGPEVVSLGSRKAVAETCDGKDEMAEKGKDGNKVEGNRPPRTFDDILERMGKGRRVPTALREQRLPYNQLLELE